MRMVNTNKNPMKFESEIVWSLWFLFSINLTIVCLLVCLLALANNTINSWHFRTLAYISLSCFVILPITKPNTIFFFFYLFCTPFGEPKDIHVPEMYPSFLPFFRLTQAICELLLMQRFTFCV